MLDVLIDQSVDEFEKIYVNLMKFATKPKEKMLVLCFYMNHYIKHSESVGYEKAQQTVYDTLQVEFRLSNQSNKFRKQYYSWMGRKQRITSHSRLLQSL